MLVFVPFSQFGSMSRRGRESNCKQNFFFLFLSPLPHPTYPHFTIPAYLPSLFFPIAPFHVCVQVLFVL
ncbi:hypothetical protein K457DRAFT_1108727 [Linnemannia elongata AG-77]|uniref:Uncharacterized protein n=1 Tax=Linnemannia elongata AG-77 TaxID=1314771 RepID=A0A197JEZ3_9FUNG|nr:hypothetical protein K457DRAFT_1108727 [Linnemannia elongata AG-77]